VSPGDPAIGESALPTSLTVNAAIQLMGDAKPRLLTFDGQPSFTDTYGVHISDYVGVDDGCHWGSKIFAIQCARGANYPGIMSGTSDPAGININRGEGCAVGDTVALGRIASSDLQVRSGRLLYAPVAILGFFKDGIGAPPSMQSIVDSHGATNEVYGGSNVGGEWRRWCMGQFTNDLDNTLGARCAFIDTGKGSEANDQWLANCYVRAQFLDYVRYVAVAVSNHDPDHGQNLATWKSTVVQLIAKAASGRHVEWIVVTPPYPKVNGTMESIASQVPASPADRPAMLAWLGSADFYTAINPYLRPGQKVTIVNQVGAIEADSNNVPTLGGGYFYVQDATTLYEGVAVSGLGTGNAQVSFTKGAPTPADLRAKTVMFSTGPAGAINQCTNINYASLNANGTTRLILASAISTAPQVGNTFNVYAVGHGPTSRDGIHANGAGKVLVAVAMDNAAGMPPLVYRAVKAEAIVTPPIPVVDPTTWNSTLYFDPRLPSKLFKDTGGATPVASDNDTAKLFKGSNLLGTRNDASSSVGATYKTSGGAFDIPHLQFDGVDDMLKVAGLNTSQTLAPQPFWTMFVIHSLTTAFSKVFFDGGSSNVNNRARFQNNSSGVNYIISAAQTQAVGAKDITKPLHFLIYWNGTSSYYIREGGSKVLLPGGVGANVMDGITFGADYLGGNFGNMDLYFFASFQGTPTPEQVSGALAWMADNFQ